MSRSQGRQMHQSQVDYGRRRQNSPDTYQIDGNTVRKVRLETILEEKPKNTRQSNVARKNREKAVHMNLGYVMFLVAALMVAGVVLIGYINLQSDISNSISRISQKQSELHQLRQDNDEYETRINSSVDLEEIKRIALNELGMKYASEGQIVNVEGGNNDYVRKFAEIP